MDDTIASFLYYMFPKEMFVRALSLIESSNMFIYAFDIQEVNSRAMEPSDSASTNPDESVRQNSSESTSFVPANKPSSPHSATTHVLVAPIYENDSELLYRLIVKADSDTDPSVYVDLTNWFCSCEEFANGFLEHGLNGTSKEDDIAQRLTREVTELQDFSDDRFAQLDAHSLSKQRYFHHDKVMCPHLLAFSILLRSSPSVLQYFAVNKGQVLLIPITNMDEWLKLHINIVA